MGLMTNPFNLMPTGNPDKFPGLFTPVNVAKPRAIFLRPDAFRMLAKDAFEVVSFLNLLGFRFSVPKFVDHSTMEGHLKDADPNDTTLREYLTTYVGKIGEHNLAMIVDNLGGLRSSPQKGLLQLLDETGLKAHELRTIPTDEQIVESLEIIFKN